MSRRILMSPPHMEGDELALLREAFESNWIAPLGPQVDAFEREMAALIGVKSALALSSGTAAIHLALRVLGVREEAAVVCSTLSFVASANPILYERAKPVFVDSERTSWNMDPNLLVDTLRDLRERNEPAAAVIAVDIFGQCANYEEIEQVCARFEVPLIEDAAEALGATCRGRKAGSFGSAGVLSFNGNKILTTSGGGMLLSDDEDLLREARELSTQARDPAPHYEHSRLGYNYRLSNLLAAVGRGQLRHLEDRVDRRRAIFRRYEEGLGDLPGIGFMPEAEWGRCNRWLSCITLDPERSACTPEVLRQALAEREIESRPIWKPLHLQPLFEGCEVVGGEVAERIFATGLCLPSGSAMTGDEQARVVDTIRETMLA